MNSGPCTQITEAPVSEGTYAGLLYGVLGDPNDALFLPRHPYGHKRINREDCTREWYAWDGSEGVVWGAMIFEGDAIVWFVGMPVRVAPCRVADLARDGDYGVENARAVWERFRAYCLLETDCDPGVGEFLAVSGDDS